MSFRASSKFSIGIKHFYIGLPLCVAGVLFGCAETTTLQGSLAVAWQRCNDENWFPDLAKHPILRARNCEAHVRESNGLPPTPPPTSILDVRPIAIERPARSAVPPAATPPARSAGTTTQRQSSGSVSAPDTGSGSHPAMQCVSVTPTGDNGWFAMRNNCNYIITVGWCYAGTSDCKNGNWGYTNTGNIAPGGTRPASTFTSRAERKGLIFAACSGRDAYIQESGPKLFTCK